MKILLCSTSTDKGHMGGIHHGYGQAFRNLGHKVHSIGHRQAAGHKGDGYDFFLLRDTAWISPQTVLSLKARSRHFAMFTHSECIQGDRDADFIEAVKPEYVFLDQQLSAEGTAFSRLNVPMRWLGYGANPACSISPNKDIDILWVGNSFPARQPWVEEHILPLVDMDHGYSVRIHGKGQRDGELLMDDMFPVLARA